MTNADFTIITALRESAQSAFREARQFRKDTFFATPEDQRAAFRAQRTFAKEFLTVMISRGALIEARRVIGRHTYYMRKGF